MNHFAYVNHARIHSWNKPVLSKSGSILLKVTMGAFEWDQSQTHDRMILSQKF